MERNMDESRKAFERFLREEHLYTDEELVWEDDRNCYSIYPVHIAWKSWQASRAAIEIDLPDELTIEDCIDKDIDVCRATHFNLGMGKLEQAIRSAGIKVKE
ncbi:hypothetical protein U9D55_000439 [Enterobacter roggenkampii]|nr:hypothetical protein [Enterobacter roggenkampii]